MIIGVTGLMGAGKTTLCRSLLEQYPDLQYIEVDYFRRQLLLNNTTYCEELKKALELDSLHNLNDIIYKDEIRMNIYKNILYRYLNDYLGKLSQYIILDWALLIQDGMTSLCDKLIILQSTKEECLKRLNLTDKEMELRLDIQLKGLTSVKFNQIQCPVLKINFFSKDFSLLPVYEFIQDKNLSSSSDAYYNENKYYNLYSEAEDKQGKLSTFLLQALSNKSVLDAGCGSGKFTDIIEPATKQYYGIDLSEPQVQIARQKLTKDTSKIYQGDLEHIPLPDKSVDITYAAWVLGTIQNKAKRTAVIKELERVTRDKIILIENGVTGEYEHVRRHDVTGSTITYNNYLLSQGFTPVREIQTAFEFNSLEEAKEVFIKIYGEHGADFIHSRNIEHHILIFEKVVK